MFFFFSACMEHLFVSLNFYFHFPQYKMHGAYGNGSGLRLGVAYSSKIWQKLELNSACVNLKLR